MSPQIYRALSVLRLGIRCYVLLEGLAIASIWLCLSFWVAMAIDYVPVSFGLNELPFFARLAILTVVATTFVIIVARLVVIRLVVSIRDSSLAILIERTFGQFNESLITTVDSVTRTGLDPNEIEMARQSRLIAEKSFESVRLSQVLKIRPLVIRLLTAILLLSSIGVYGYTVPTSFDIASRRLVRLENVLWPRVCQIELVGVKIKRENSVEGIPELGLVLKARDSQFKIAKGTSMTVMIRAEFDSKPSATRRLPASCVLRYWNKNGISGRHTMKRIGTPRKGYQSYTFDGRPFAGVLSDLTFDVVGDDHRIGPFEIEVVDSPVVIDTKLSCIYPSYMVDSNLTRWSPRTIPYFGATRLPYGTTVEIECKTNKPIKRIYLNQPNGSQSMKVLNANANRFSFDLPDLKENHQFLLYLCDTDGIVSENPHVVTIESIEDQPPLVQTRLKGIGSAITPDAMIPLEGSIEDDYGLARTWLEIETPVTNTIRHPIAPETDGTLISKFDFRDRRQSTEDSFTLPTGQAQTVSLTLKTADRFNLGNGENIGMGDRYVLDIVSPGRLLRILERSEVGQRRRLEQISDELNDARGYLTRTHSSQEDSAAGIEPGDGDAESTHSTDGIKRIELQLLYAQRASLQIAKSEQETAGVAELFENIRLQLINNRVDSKDRKTRLSTKVILPLRNIAEHSMPELQAIVTELEKSLRELQNNENNANMAKTANQQAFSAIQSADRVLVELDLVLGALVKYETQNELLEIVRQLIKKQKDILERTKKERQNQAFESIFD